MYRHVGHLYVRPCLDLSIRHRHARGNAVALAIHPVDRAEMSQSIQLVWKGDFRFDGTARGGTVTSIDGNAAAGTTPVDLLLQSVGACAAIDVVDILKKSRQEVQGMAVEVEATRREEPPRHVKRLDFRFRIKGPVDQGKAERAVDLSLEKYCSVFHTLRMDINLDVEVKVID